MYYIVLDSDRLVHGRRPERGKQSLALALRAHEHDSAHGEPIQAHAEVQEALYLGEAQA